MFREISRLRDKALKCSDITYRKVNNYLRFKTNEREEKSSMPFCSDDYVIMIVYMKPPCPVFCQFCIRPYDNKAKIYVEIPKIR